MASLGRYGANARLRLLAADSDRDAVAEVLSAAFGEG